jgi:hypothetical protein
VTCSPDRSVLKSAVYQPRSFADHPALVALLAPGPGAVPRALRQAELRARRGKARSEMAATSLYGVPNTIGARAWKV